jgi:hypothetical protein
MHTTTYHPIMASRFRERVGDRLRQIRLAFTQTRAHDNRLVPYMAAAAVTGLLLPLTILTWLGSPVLGVIAGLAMAAPSALVVLGIRGQNAAIAQIEGQPGAALAVLQQLRGAWKVTPAVAFSGKQDLVHRVVGRPGVILVGEGRRSRVRALLRQEARKTARISGEIPVHEVSVGRADDQVELGSLRMHVMKLPRAMKAKEIGPLDRRLHALGGSDLPLPKGPLPNVRRPR